MTASTQPAPREQHADDQNRQTLSWSKRSRVIVSCLVIAHLMAVAVPPLAFQSVGPLGLSPAVESALFPVEQYSQMLYLDRGYAFFAPDPGPSHLIQAGLTDGAGKLTERMYPDRQEQWPRLLYHRHFMLTEYLNDVHQPPGPPEDLVKSDAEAAASWSAARTRYEHVRQSMSEHLEAAYPGNTAAIRRIEHLIPGVIEFQEQPISLTDRRLYQFLLDQPPALRPDGDLVAPDRPPEAVPAPDGKDSREGEASSSESDPEGDDSSEAPES